MSSSSLRRPRALKVATASALSALGLILSPYLWFPVGASKAYPGQHLVNVLAGVLLGPLYAAAVALVVGVLRNALGVGTIFAFPGGLPGGVVVGLTRAFLRKKLGDPASMIVAAMTEPLGTVLIGGSLSWFIFDPLMGYQLHLKLGALSLLYWGWLLSSLSGVALSIPVILAVYKATPGLVHD